MDKDELRALLNDLRVAEKEDKSYCATCKEKYLVTEDMSHISDDCFSLSAPMISFHILLVEHILHKDE